MFSYFSKRFYLSSPGLNLNSPKSVRISTVCLTTLSEENDETFN